MAIDFLPICDLLFNFISVASYFCDVAFDILTLYTLYQDGLMVWALSLSIALISSLLLTQIVSFKWCLEEENRELSSLRKTVIYIIHLALSGVLWRYSKLFAPIDIHLVKKEMGNLCVLRMIHSFVEAMPFLLIQGFLMASSSSSSSSTNIQISQLNYISMSLSLFNICWSVASFNKNIRTSNVHKLVLTWIGVIFQFVWRLGTITSRIISLIVYSSVYGLWVFLAIVLHWLIMFLWIQFTYQGGGERSSSIISRFTSTFILSYIYIFCFVNIDVADTKFKLLIFYLITFSENILLTTMWTWSLQASLYYSFEDRQSILITVIISFISGIIFMCIYYKLFHVSKLGHNGGGVIKETNVANSGGNLSRNSRNGNSSKILNGGSNIENKPGGAVFNCALNPAMRKKKKKIPSIIPVPPRSTTITHGEKSQKPFWKEPLPLQDQPNVASHPYTNNCQQSEYRNNTTTSLEEIQIKLQEKREKQMQQLRILQGEIEAGKISRPKSEVSISEPTPFLKKQPYIHLHEDNNSYYRHPDGLINYSSGDQGDIDSGDEIILQNHRSRYTNIPRSNHETPL